MFWSTVEGDRETLLGKGNVWEGDSMLKTADLAGSVVIKK